MTISLPESKIAGVEIPQTDLISKCLVYVNEHNVPALLHHSIRSAIWSLIIRSKVALFKEVDPESIVVSTLLHDLGFSLDDKIRSPDKRFEVDGANAARTFIASETKTSEGGRWDDIRLQAIWDAITLHSTPSIALHGQPIVHLACWAITADFMGPFVPGSVITVDEYKEVIKAYPRVGFSEVLAEACCGLCKTKPETTYHNFTGDYGRGRVEGYEAQWEENRLDRFLGSSLKACEQYE